MKKTKFTQIYTGLLIIVIAVWVVLAIARTGNNVSKVVTEEKDWLALSEREKKTRLFGNLYTFLLTIKAIIPPGESITLLTDDNRVYYFNKYTLYPLKTNVIEVKNDNKKIQKISTGYAALFIKNNTSKKRAVDHLQDNGYKQFDYDLSVPEGELYKK